MSDIKAQLWREHDNWILKVEGPRWMLEDFSKHIRNGGIRISSDVTLTIGVDSSQDHMRTEHMLLEAGSFNGGTDE